MSRKTPALEFKLRLDESDFKTAVNKASSDFSRGLQGMTNHAQSQSRQITQALSNIQGFRDLKKQIQETETQLQEATGEVARLAREIQASEAPTRQMSRAFEQAKKRAKSLKDQFDGQRTSLHSLRGTLREAGIDTTRLGNNQKQLQNKMAEATREAKEQSRVIKAFSTIGVRSVREVETEVQRLRSAYRDLSRSGRVSATDLNRAHKKMKSRIRELRREMSGLNSSMTSMGASIKGLVGAYAGFVSLQAASGFIKDSILTFANFDDTMRQVGATSGATKKELKSLTELAKEMGASTRFSATQAAEGLKTMSLAGLSAKQQMAALPRVLELAAAGSVDMETAAGIATTALAQFGLKATDLAAVNNVLVTAFTSSATNIQDLGLAMQYAGPVAKAAGSNFKETATVLALLAKNGFSGEKAGTALRAAYARLLLPTKNAQKAIEKLGLKTRDASGELLPMTQILRNLRSTGADATAMIRIFGVEAAPALTSAVGMSSRAFEDLVNKFRDMGNVSADVAKKMEAGMGGSIRSLEAAWEGVKIAIGEAIDQSQTLQLKELVQYINQNKDAIVQLALAGVDLAAMLARVALEIGQFILKWQDTIVVLGSAFIAVKVLGIAFRAFTAIRAASWFLSTSSAATTLTAALGAQGVAGAVTGMGTTMAGATGIMARLGGVMRGALAVGAAAGAVEIGKLAHVMWEAEKAETAVEDRAKSATAAFQILSSEAPKLAGLLADVGTAAKKISSLNDAQLQKLKELIHAKLQAIATERQRLQLEENRPILGLLTNHKAKLDGLTASEKNLITTLMATIDAEKSRGNVAVASLSAQRKELGKTSTAVGSLRQEVQTPAVLKIAANTSNAVIDIARVKAAMAELRDRTVTIKIHRVESHATGGFAGGVTAMARGGRLPGFGGGDKIPALLEAGEFVVRKERARIFSGLLAMMNYGPISRVQQAMREIPRFQTGGIVQNLHIPQLAMAGGGSVPSPGPIERFDIRLNGRSVASSNNSGSQLRGLLGELRDAGRGIS